MVCLLAPRLSLLNPRHRTIRVSAVCPAVLFDPDLTSLHPTRLGRRLFLPSAAPVPPALPPSASVGLCNLRSTRGFRYPSQSLVPSIFNPFKMTKIPCQQMVTTADKKLLVLAFGYHLQVFEASTGKLLSSTSMASTNPAGSNHTGLIRLLVIHHKPSVDSDKPAILISTGEDKLLKTWELPSLKSIDSRELIKRATSIAVSPNGKNIVIADKFGDVYDLPFDAPLQTVFQSDPDQDQPPQASEKDPIPTDSSKTQDLKPVSKSLAPIAGHVSVLTSLTFVPTQPVPLLVTADRDEHIRLSRYPKAWSIVSYLLGHRKFVSALLWISTPGGDVSSGRLLSGGGDNEIYVWDYSTASCLKKIDVGGLAKGMKVRPQKQAWFSKTRTNKRRRRQQDSKNGSVDQAQADQNEGGEDRGSEGACDLEKGADQSKSFVERTCVNKILCTTSCDSAGLRHVLVTSVGSSILATIPLSSVLTSQADHDDQVKYHDLGVPILDIADLSDRHILVSLDSTLSPSTPVDSSSSDIPPLFRILTIGPDQLEESPESTFPFLTQLSTSASIEPSAELAMPTSDSLYPELLLFTKDEPSGAHAEPVQTLDAPRAGGRSGKKEEGRQLSQQRCEMVLERASLTHKS